MPESLQSLIEPDLFGDLGPRAWLERHDEPGLFDFLIGSWTCVSRARLPDGGTVEGRAAWTAEWVLDGRAILEEYRRVNDDGSRSVFVNVRTRDAESGAWVAKSFDGEREVWTELPFYRMGNEVRGEAEQRSGTTRSLVRVRFREISAERFVWQGDRSDDGGESWTEEALVIEALRVC